MLTYAVKVQNMDAVFSLVKMGADPNVLSGKGVTPISVAAHKGNLDIMRFLIESGAAVNAPNSSGSTALIQVLMLLLLLLLLKTHFLCFVTGFSFWTCRSCQTIVTLPRIARFAKQQEDDSVDAFVARRSHRDCAVAD